MLPAASFRSNSTLSPLNTIPSAARYITIDPSIGFGWISLVIASRIRIAAIMSSVAVLMKAAKIPALL
jgi:hypothetical protein